MIADTSFLIDLFVGRNDAKDFVAKNIVCTTSISIFELFKGLRDSELEKLDSLLSEIIVLDFDVESAKLAGIISRDLSAKGLEIDVQDCMIGAIALIKGFSVVSKNVKHFSRIKKLSLVSY